MESLDVVSHNPSNNTTATSSNAGAAAGNYNSSMNSSPAGTMGAFQPVLPFSDVAHPKELLSMLMSLRGNEELCDVTLIVGDRHITAHKAVLSACSPYFRAMFTGGCLEQDMQEIEIHVSAEGAFSDVIDYFYSAKLTINEQNVEELIPVAGMLQLPRLQQACCEVIKRKITTDNCLGITAFAECHSCPQLAESAHTYSVSHYTEVVHGEEFMKIDVEHLCKLLADDGLCVNSEERVFESVVMWIRHDDANRKKYADQLFPHVRFPLLSAEFLMDRVAHEEIIREDRVCCDLLLEATKFLLIPKRKSSSLTARILPRKSTSCRQVMYAIGGMSRREAMKSAERYDPKEGRWKATAEMSICRFAADVASSGGNLFVCGGSDATTRLRTAERYDMQNNAWLPLPEMSSNRNGVGVAMVGGKIYAVGGFNGSTPLSTAECYDPKTGKWSSIASMNQARFGVGCCACPVFEQIYAIGGSDGNNLRTCERYNVETNTWLPIAPMSVARKQVTCATLNRYVYAIGGCDYSARYQSVERYDPTTDHWVAVAPLLSPRSGAGVGVLDGLLYVCGGFDGNQYLNTVEKYDSLTNHWSPGPPMINARDCVAVCVATYKKPHNRRSADLQLPSTFQRPHLNFSSHN